MVTGRSTDYRAKWFRQNRTKSGKYRCVYCGRKLPAKKIVIDHIIPIHKAQTSFFARMRLRRLGIHDVNDQKNLVPACKRCNEIKGSHIGLYPFIARLGRHKSWWAFVKILKVAIVITAIYLIYEFYPTLLDVFGR